jgi:hypothetical protein
MERAPAGNFGRRLGAVDLEDLRVAAPAAAHDVRFWAAS